MRGGSDKAIAQMEPAWSTGGMRVVGWAIAAKPVWAGAGDASLPTLPAQRCGATAMSDLGYLALGLGLLGASAAVYLQSPDLVKERLRPGGRLSRRYGGGAVRSCRDVRGADVHAQDRE